jgi:hypothetical protein
MRILKRRYLLLLFIVALMGWVSPDSHLLYIPSFMANQGFDQFDVTLGTQSAIQSSQQTILSDNDGTLGSGSWARTKNLSTSWNSNKLTVIHPNNHGAACNLAYKSLTIAIRSIIMPRAVCRLLCRVILQKNNLRLTFREADPAQTPILISLSTKQGALIP